MRFTGNLIQKHARLFPGFLSGILFLALIVGTHPWNSDLLYLEAIYRDLFVNHLPLREFHFSASTFTLPDFPLYLAFRALCDQLNLVLLGYMGVQLGLVLFLFKNWFQKPASLTYLFPIFFLFSVFDSDWFTVFYPVHHGGQWILGTLLLFNFGPLRRPSKKSLILTSLFSGLLASCDILFAINGIAPYGLLLLMDSGPEKNRSHFKKGILWCVLSLIFTLAFYFLFRKVTGSYFGWNKPVFGNGERARDFFHEFFAPNLFSALFVSALLILAARFKRDATARFLLFAVAISAFSIVLTGVWAGHTNVRYFIPAIFAMTYAWTQAAVWAWNRKVILIPMVLALLSLTSLQVKHYLSQQVQSPFEAPYTRAHECLDRFSRETGFKEGVGNYWPSKWLSFFSKESVKVLQTNDNLEPYYWINNHTWYRNFKPRFIIVNYFTNGQYSPGALAHLGLGEPLEKRNCEKFEIWTYPEGTKILREPVERNRYPNLNEFRN